MGKNTVVIDKNELEELKKAAHDLAEENVHLRQKLDRMNELLLMKQKQNRIIRLLNRQRTPLLFLNTPARPSAP